MIREDAVEAQNGYWFVLVELPPHDRQLLQLHSDLAEDGLETYLLFLPFDLVF